MTSLALAQITDTHLGPPGAVDAGQRAAQLAAVVQHLTAGPALDAVLATGDLADTAHPDTYVELARTLRGLQAPVLALPGNHDDPAALRAVFPESPLERPSLWCQGHWAVVGLNSQVAGCVDGTLGQQRRAALGALLGRIDQPHLLVSLHHPPMPVGSPWIDAMALSDGPALLELLARDGRTRVLLAGHVHQDFVAVHQRMALYTTPSTWAQFKPRSPAYAIVDRRPGYRWLRLHPDGRHHTGVVHLPSAPS